MNDIVDIDVGLLFIFHAYMTIYLYEELNIQFGQTHPQICLQGLALAPVFSSRGTCWMFFLWSRWPFNGSHGCRRDGDVEGKGWWLL